MQHTDTAIRIAAMELARDHSPPFLFTHVMRTFAFGRETGVLNRLDKGRRRHQRREVARARDDVLHRARNARNQLGRFARELP